MARRKRGGRPRKAGALRHPDGTTVRSGSMFNGTRLYEGRELTDEERAKLSDFRNNSAPGRLERDKLITPLQKLAGERWLMKLQAYRNKDLRSPSPNARAANLMASTGQAREPDWDSIGEDEQERIKKSRRDFQEANLKILAHPLGAKIEKLIHDTFCLDRDPAPQDVPLMVEGLEILEFHFGIVGQA